MSLKFIKQEECSDFLYKVVDEDDNKLGYIDRYGWFSRKKDGIQFTPYEMEKLLEKIREVSRND